ncbi:MAG: hypothetical protein ACE5ER_09320, partial [Nitrospinaceae bacterium]
MAFRIFFFPCWLAVMTAVLLSWAPAFPDPGGAAKVAAGVWKILEPGLELAAFQTQKNPGGGESEVHVLRIDPAHFEFRLLNASNSSEGKPLSAREWSRRYELVAAINASMYQADHMTSVALMKTGEHTNNN